MKEKQSVCSLLCHTECKMLTEFTAGSSKADFMILQPGYRRRSWSDAVTTPRLLNRQAGFKPYRRPRISSFAVPGKNVERIKINVSGKRYELTYSRLFKFPKSLLARSTRRAYYYDAEKDEFFFDRNRMAFESVYNFYQTAGEFVRPEHIPDNLLLQEMQFFGLVQYLSLPGSDSSPVCSPKAAKRTNPNNRYQRMIWELFENPGSSVAARLVNVLVLLLIILSIIVMCIETLPEFNDADMSPTSRNHRQTTINQTYNTRKQLESLNRTETNHSLSRKLKKLFIVEAFCVVCFSLELLIRFIVSPDKLRFFCNVLNIFDLLAVLPFYVALAISAQSLTAVQSAYVLRVLRLTRAFRLVKIYRYSSTVQVFVKTIRECIKDFLMLGFLILMTMIVFASCSYYFEQEYEGTNFVSIPAACWWAIITMTSVGYGDMVPVTPGRLHAISVCYLIYHKGIMGNSTSFSEKSLIILSCVCPQERLLHKKGLSREILKGTPTTEVPENLVFAEITLTVVILDLQQQSIHLLFVLLRIVYIWSKKT